MFSLHFFEVEARSSMCQILVLFFKMGNLIYGSFAIEALSIVDTLFSNLLDFVSLCG